MKIDLSFQFETLDEMRQVFHCLLQDFKIETTAQQPPEPEKELFQRNVNIRALKMNSEEEIQACIDSQADKFKAVEVVLTESKKPVKLYDFVGVQSIVCPGCNKLFIKKRKDQTFCSKVCHKNYKVPSETIVCPTCNKPFKQENKNNLYCSKECRPSSMKPQELTEDICPVCGNKFDKKPKIKYCSKKCATKAKNLKYNVKQALKKQAAAAIIQQNYGKTTMVADPAPVDSAPVVVPDIVPASQLVTAYC